MIAIVNISPNADPVGEATYELRINRAVITTFTHNRSQGLGECLRRAGEAADRAAQASMHKELERFAQVFCLRSK